MPQQPLPNATAVLVLGILSIPTCCCYGMGLILGIIALVLAGKDRKRYREAPGMYTSGSLSNLNAGRICAIIGVSLTSVYLLSMVIAMMIFGVEVLSDPDAMREIIEQYQK
ncbi:MAG: DUF4190 domain-containing protein [Sphingobacteriales bacterium]|nr:MAG: DUF4190 domain-containing protein [Sphingobacteriales bacterium]